MINILDKYNKNAPNPQSTIDLFTNLWSSKLPEVDGISVTSGEADLFNDSRIKLMNDSFSIKNRTVLELGPLEAAHTYMLEMFGASEIVSVESNSNAFIKCLIVKELYKLKHTSFFYGDAIEYMKSCKRHFDICLASGILYHSKSPGQFIQTISNITDRIFIWTHFFDIDEIKKKPEVYNKFKGKSNEILNEYSFEINRYEYGEALNWEGFCGGSENYTSWITKETLLKILAICGFSNVTILFEDFNHQNGPHICLYASKN